MEVPQPPSSTIVGHWLLDILGREPTRWMTLAEIRRAVWEHLSPEVRESWVVLSVGDAISKRLSDGERRGLLEHDRSRQLWRSAPQAPLPGIGAGAVLNRGSSSS